MNNDMQSGMNKPVESYGNGNGGEATGSSKSATGMVKDMASQAGDKLMDQAEQQKRAGTEYMAGIAGAVRRAAGEFEEQSPQAAEYIRYAADQVDTLSDALRRRDIGQMMSDVQSFARRQPTAFLGVTFLAGFAAMRFLRSTAPAPRSGRAWQDDDRQAMDDGRHGSPGIGTNIGSGMGSNRDTPPTYGM